MLFSITAYHGVHNIKTGDTKHWSLIEVMFARIHHCRLSIFLFVLAKYLQNKSRAYTYVVILFNFFLLILASISLSCRQQLLL